jgi:hypothetical protein
MKIRELKTQDRYIRVSSETYERIRTAAYRQHSKIKTVFEEITSGRLDPGYFCTTPRKGILRNNKYINSNIFMFIPGS